MNELKNILKTTKYIHCKNKLSYMLKIASNVSFNVFSNLSLEIIGCLFINLLINVFIFQPLVVYH